MVVLVCLVAGKLHFIKYVVRSFIGFGQKLLEKQFNFSDNVPLTLKGNYYI